MKSYISKNEIAPGEAIKGTEIRTGVFELLQKAFHDFSSKDYISIDVLNQYRGLYLTSLITWEKGELAVIDNGVMEAIKNNFILSENTQDDMEAYPTFGQRIADKVAAFGWPDLHYCFFLFYIGLDAD